MLQPRLANLTTLSIDGVNQAFVNALALYIPHLSLLQSLHLTRLDRRPILDPLINVLPISTLTRLHLGFWPPPSLLKSLPKSTTTLVIGPECQVDGTCTLADFEDALTWRKRFLPALARLGIYIRSKDCEASREEITRVAGEADGFRFDI